MSLRQDGVVIPLSGRHQAATPVCRALFSGAGTVRPGDKAPFLGGAEIL